MEGCGEIWRSRHGTAWSGWVEYGEVRSVGRGLERSGSIRYGLDGRSGYGELRRGTVGSVRVGRGQAVVATCDKARLGWQGWAVSVCSGLAALGEAVMLGRGLIGVRKSRRLWRGNACLGLLRSGGARRSW